MTSSSKVITACALMIILSIGVLSFRSALRDEEDRGWVTHTIRKHGGRIWAEAELDQGATFFFTLESSESKTNKKPEPVIGNEVIHVARS